MIRFKHRPSDFRVLEIPDLSRLVDEGPHAVFEVTKEKRTTLEVASMLANVAGVKLDQVSYAGLKDRQGRTKQLFSVATKQKLQVDDPAVTLRFLGRSEEPVDSSWNQANRFEIVVRGIRREDWTRFEVARVELLRDGVPNYFDDQRFGCLRYGQGFVMRLMFQGRYGEALQRIVAAPSKFDDESVGFAKSLLRRNWGEWEACIRIAKGQRKYFSVFRHLAEKPGDFEGALSRIALKERLIHLYAYQSFLWNRIAGLLITRTVDADRRLIVHTDMGDLPVWTTIRSAQRSLLATGTLSLVDADVRFQDPRVRSVVTQVMSEEGVRREQLRRGDIAGFRFKAEERALCLVPSDFQSSEPEPDESEPGAMKARLAFELPRGSYATLVLKRLFQAEPGRPRLRFEAMPPRAGGPGRNDGGRAHHPPRGAGRPLGRPARGFQAGRERRGQRPPKREEN